MFNHDRFADALAQYKQDFIGRQWPNESYKWVAAKCFQDNWDVNAPDFADMLSRSLAKTYKLLASNHNFPANMIKTFAKAAPEEVRAMFIALYDESKDVVTRILDFKNQSGILFKRYGNDARDHDQNENAITTYLWLRYPDKYYIYKFEVAKDVANTLQYEHPIKKGFYADNLRHFFALYDEMRAELKKDSEMVSLLKGRITPACYPDEELCTLTMGVGFFISKFYPLKKTVAPEQEEWWPTDYSPALSVDDWHRLLEDRDVFNTASLVIMKCMKDYGGQATCTQLAEKYGRDKNFYNRGSSALAKRVAEKTGCPTMDVDDDDFRWWPILYVGKHANKKEEGHFTWKLRSELSEALDQVDLSHVDMYEKTVSEENVQHDWFLSVNPKAWSISSLPIGYTKTYSLYNENGHKRRVFQNFLDVRSGDRVIIYEASPVRQITAIGCICAEQDGQTISIKKLESLSSPINFSALRDCAELAKMEYFSMPQGNLFKLTKDEYDIIIDMIREENPLPITKRADPYGRDDFLNEVYMSEEKYDSLVAVLKCKKNIILQGAPGVGKTFAARRLAYSIMGEMDENRVEFVQFHQNYSYEDFIMGYKPVKDGFALKYGIFYRFCKKADDRPDQDFFFIIDEINRGNMSKIFGELLMLIENDYRDTKLTLAYQDMLFSVPKNLYIIGMMNTADRSLAMIDYALRRRFSFFDMEPGFDSQRFIEYQRGLNNETFDELIIKIKDLNREIAMDKSLGKGFCIGHSYFCNMTVCTDDLLRAIVDFDILPMLSEYWFDDTIKLRRWENILKGVFQR